MSPGKGSVALVAKRKGAGSGDPQLPPPEPDAVLPQHGISVGFKILQRTTLERAYELDQCALVGAEYVRVDCPPGMTAEIDSLIPMIRDRGMKVLLILYGSINAVTPTAAATFTTEMVSRYRADVKLWEFANEPDLNHDWTPATYTAASNAAYAAAKAADPGCYFMTGALWKWKDLTGQKTHDWVRGMFEAGLAGNFDAISFHGYDNPTTRASWNIWDSVFHVTGNVRALMVQYGQSAKDIVSTESGARILGEGGSYTEAQQATIVGEDFNALTTYASSNFKSMMVYTMMNDDVPGYGLLRTDRTQRPAWAIYQTKAAGLTP
jgi:hypothetical protein